MKTVIQNMISNNSFEFKVKDKRLLAEQLILTGFQLLGAKYSVFAGDELYAVKLKRNNSLSEVLLKLMWTIY